LTIPLPLPPAAWSLSQYEISAGAGLLIQINRRDAVDPYAAVEPATKRAAHDDGEKHARNLAEVVHFHRRYRRDFRQHFCRRTPVVVVEPAAGCRLLRQPLRSDSLARTRARSGQASCRFDRDGAAVATGWQHQAACSADRSIEQGACAATRCRQARTGPKPDRERSPILAVRERSPAFATRSGLTAGA
jgi:hypothetical protein